MLRQLEVVHKLCIANGKIPIKAFHYRKNLTLKKVEFKNNQNLKQFGQQFE